MKLREVKTAGAGDCPFPVGAVLQMTNEFDPNSIWPGTTWSAMSGRVLIGSGAGFAFGETGGAAEHALTVDEMPSHSHVVPAHRHAHTIKATTPKLTHSVTQPVFKYTAPKAHAHTLSSNGGALFMAGATDSYVRLHYAPGPTVAASKYTQHPYWQAAAGGQSGDRPTTTSALAGSTDSAACSDTANGATASRTTNVGVGDHAATDCTMSGSVTDKAAYDTNTTGGGRRFRCSRRTRWSTCGDARLREKVA